MPLGPVRVNTATLGSEESTAPSSMTPLRPELPAATRRSMVAATSADVKSDPSCHLTPWRRLNVHTLPSSLGLQLSARPGRDVAVSERAQELEALRDDAVAAEVLHGDRVERAGRLLAGDLDGAARRAGAGAGRLGARAAAGAGAATAAAVVIAAAGRDDGADEGHRQPDDGRPTHELAARQDALGVRLDQIELQRSHLAPGTVEYSKVHVPYSPWSSWRASRSSLPGRL